VNGLDAIWIGGTETQRGQSTNQQVKTDRDQTAYRSDNDRQKKEYPVF